MQTVPIGRRAEMGGRCGQGRSSTTSSGLDHSSALVAFDRWIVTAGTGEMPLAWLSATKARSGWFGSSLCWEPP